MKTITSINVGDMLKHDKRNKLSQVVKITDKSVFIKSIGCLDFTPIRYDIDLIDVNKYFTFYC